MRWAFGLVLLGLASVAWGQTCLDELQERATQVHQDAGEGVVAAELLAAAVRLVEPALPPLRLTAEVPVQPGGPGYDAVRYLAERDLLPPAWEPDLLTPLAWQEMLSGFLRWYGLPGRVIEAEPTADTLVADLAAVLTEVSTAVRPLALIASAQEDRSRIAFLGVVWNWSIYPRLIVRRPSAEQSLAEGLEPLLDDLGNCAVSLEHYVYAPEDTARDLFLSNGDARMYVIGSEPELQAWPLLVPDGQEDAFFSFSAPAVRDLAAYAAAFDGNQLGVRSLMAMLPRLRTNLPPTRIPGLLSTPHPR